MANPKRAVGENVPGDFFVDDTCIDCDTCRQLAPASFADAGEHSYVAAQPGDETQLRQAYRALLSCPTASIGVMGENRAREFMADFPLPLGGEIYYCGYTSARSYGASSYLIRHPGGNWLVDSPKYLPQLAERIEALGGIARIFLTHRDDVADAARFARHFGAQRLIMRGDLDAMPDAERVLDEETLLQDEFRVIPTPGHTRGHAVLLYRGVLFSGDHLEWEGQHLGAHPGVCWYSWAEQTASMEKLLAHDISRLLPGHGRGVTLEAAAMRRELEALVRRMKLTPG